MGSCTSTAKRPPGGAAPPRRGQRDVQQGGGLYGEDSEHSFDSADFQSCVSTADGDTDGFKHRLSACHTPPSAVRPHAPPGQAGALPPDLALRCPEQAPPTMVLEGWDFLPAGAGGPPVDRLDHLRKGGALFTFATGLGTRLSPADLRILRLSINRSGFRDELAENGNPTIDVDSPEDQAGHTFLMGKSCYLLPPPLSPSDITPELLSSKDFRKFCEYGAKVHETRPQDVHTFRITKPIIRPLYSVTVQFKVTEIRDRAELEKLSALCDGWRVDHAVLLERTKRDFRKRDNILKLKNLQLYYCLDGGRGGMLCTNINVLASRSLPGWIARMMNSLSEVVAKDWAETATTVRKYMLKARKAEAAG